MTTAAKKDTNRFARQLERLGFRVERRRHIKVYDSEGKLLATAARTPSDSRSFKNFQKRMEPHLRELERRRAEMPYVSPKANKRNDQVRDQVIELLGAGVTTMDFAKYVQDVAERDNLKGYKNVESANNSLYRFARHGQKLSTWAIDLIEAALQGLNGHGLPVQETESINGPERPELPESTDLKEGPVAIESTVPREGPGEYERTDVREGPITKESAVPTEGAIPDESTDDTERPLMGAQMDTPPDVSEHDDLYGPDLPLLDLSIDLSLRCLSAMHEGVDTRTALQLAMEIRQMELRSQG